jgi:putative oxidoreductase
MACGLAFPLAGAAFSGLMSFAAVTDHRGKGFFVFKGGWEYVALIGVIAAALVSIGPGRYSADAALGWHLAGPGWAGLGRAGDTGRGRGQRRLYVAATRRAARAESSLADGEVPG